MKKMISLTLLSTGFLFCQCELDEVVRNEGEQINIGLMVPISSSSAGTAYALRRACGMAAFEINQNGGVLGKSLQLKIVDTEGEADVSVAKAQELLSENIVAFIGPVRSGNTIAVAEQVAIPAGIPIITPASTSPAITSLEKNTNSDLVFRTVASDSIVASFAGSYVYEQLGKTTAGIIYVNDAYGSGLAQSFSESFTTAGGTVLNSISYAGGKTEAEINVFDFAPLVDSLFSSQPEAIYLVARSQAGSRIAIAAEEYISEVYDPVFIGVDAVINSLDFLREAPTLVTDGMYNFIAAANPDNPNYQDFRDAYFARYSFFPRPYADNAYDAVYLIAYAIEAAQSEDPLQIALHLREVAAGGEVVNINGFAVASALLEDGVSIDYNGASGSLQLDGNGDVVSVSISVLVSNTKSFEAIENITFGN